MPDLNANPLLVLALLFLLVIAKFRNNTELSAVICK